jgi:hypothetical protein
LDELGVTKAYVLPKEIAALVLRQRVGNLFEGLMLFIQPHVAVVKRAALKQVLVVLCLTTARGLDLGSRSGVTGLISIQFDQIHASNCSSQDM